MFVYDLWRLDIAVRAFASTNNLDGNVALSLLQNLALIYYKSNHFNWFNHLPLRIHRRCCATLFFIL